MSDLKLVPEIPKPEGFDLRDKRSDKTRSGSDWLPADALYSVSKKIEGKEIDSVIIFWREKLPDGGSATNMSFAGPKDSGQALILNGMGRFMGWEKSV